MAQFYLLTSTCIPTNTFILTQEDSGAAQGGYSYHIEEDFCQTLKPLGNSVPPVAELGVGDDVVFAGILYGDGTHFDGETDYTWGILGEIRPYASDVCVIYDHKGNDLGEFETGDALPNVLPPEAFGLKRAAWWKDRLSWC